MWEWYGKLLEGEEELALLLYRGGCRYSPAEKRKVKGFGQQNPTAVAPLALCPYVVLEMVPLAIGVTGPLLGWREGQ